MNRSPMPTPDPAKRLTTLVWLTRTPPGERDRQVRGPQVPLSRAALFRAVREREASR